MKILQFLISTTIAVSKDFLSTESVKKMIFISYFLVGQNGQNIWWRCKYEGIIRYIPFGWQHKWNPV